MVLAMVVAWPALRRPPTDGFPLSTYPMFATDRGREARVATAVGLTAHGERVRLSPELLAGTDEPMIAVGAARDAVSDAGSPETWCAEVARRVAAGRPGVERIDVVVEEHDAVAHFADDADPLAVDVRATCDVPAR